MKPLKLFNFKQNKGGQSGLFVGISLLSIFEIVEFWIDFLSNLIMKRKSSKKVSDSIEP